MTLGIDLDVLREGEVCQTGAYLVPGQDPLWGIVFPGTRNNSVADPFEKGHA